MPETRTIIHTEASRGWGGQEMRTITECLWFKEQGWNVIILTKPDATISEKALENGLQVIHRPLTKKTQIADIFAIRKIFEEEKPYLVATHSTIDSRVCLLAAKWVGVPHRIRYRHVSLPVSKSFWNRYIYGNLATNVVTTGDCISNPLIKDLKLDPTKVHTIKTGIKPPAIIPDRETSRLNLCRELGLPETTRFLGQVSVLRRWKGNDDVMNAFNSFADENPDYHLVFVGGGHGINYFPPMAAELKNGKKIHFVGHKPNPWDYLCALDINTLASTSGEGIPQTGMQSMLCQTPFVGARAGGIPEIIQNRETGILVDTHSPDQILQAFRDLTSDKELYTNLQKTALAWAKENTTVAKMANQILALIDPQKTV